MVNTAYRPFDIIAAIFGGFIRGSVNLLCIAFSFLLINRVDEWVNNINQQSRGKTNSCCVSYRQALIVGAIFFFFLFAFHCLHGVKVFGFIWDEYFAWKGRYLNLLPNLLQALTVKNRECRDIAQFVCSVHSE